MFKIVHILLILANLVFNSASNEVNDKSSLVFVFDTTGSMYNDLKQLREGAEMILRTALESDIIEDFVFVPFHDPAVGPATVTRDKAVFQAALNIIRVYGGGDCPERSLTGLQLALNVSRPRSFVYVFTDATAADHRLAGRVLELLQRKQSQAIRPMLELLQKKQSQVVFVLTGHCNDLKRPSYLVYQQIAAASSGQVFNLNKTNVHKVLDFVKNSIKARTVNLGSVRNPAGYNYTQGIPVDSTLGEVTVSVSGTKPRIQVFSPTGEQVTGPPQLETTLDLAEIMVVKVLQPEPGNWSITVGSAAEHSVKVVGLSNLTFHHGFSVQSPVTAIETSYRPLRGAYNFMLISLTGIQKNVTISFAEILTLEGKTLFEIPLKQVDSVNQVYLADAFLPPDEFFYIAINGVGENNQELRRVGATAIQAKSPEVPYLTVPKKVEAFAHHPVTLRCDVESLVPVSALWTRDGARLQQQTSSLQSTSIQYVISEMGEESVGTYRCVARNVAGVSQATTEVELLVEPPVVTISASNTTLLVGDKLTVACTVLTESVLTKYQMVFNGTSYHNVTEVSLEPNFDGVYHFNKTIDVSEQDGGMYSCVAANRGGQQTRSLIITVSNLPSAQILGPHTLPRAINSLIQLICHVESCTEVQWLYNGAVVEKHAVNGSSNSMLEKEMHADGVWTCVALQGKNKASDSVEIIAVMKPEVSIEGVKNITILNGTEHTVTCLVKAKPTPRIVWHKETDSFLNNTITVISPNLYKSVLTINSKNGEVNGTYFCFGENSEGIHQDSVTVDVRRAMTLIQGFSDISTQLYSNISMQCQIDSYPKAQIKWRHNGTDLVKKTNVHVSEDGSNITIENVNFDNLGLYTCEANNGYEKVFVNGTLSVHGLEIPVLIKKPSRVVTQKGNATILTCSIIKSNPKPTLTWQYRTTASFIQLPSDAILSDNGSIITINNTTIDHVGSYRCVAENVLGNDYYDVELTVNYAPELKDISKREPLQVELGMSMSLSCEAMGIPKPLVVWTKDGKPLIFTKNVHLISDSDLVIEKATEYDSGLFSCNATNMAGSSWKNFNLTVYAPPKITRPGFEPPIDYLEGQLVELPCAAEGLPRPEVTWLQNGNPITEDRKFMDEFGIRFVANLTDFGDYTCVVSNKHGSENSTYAVYIWVPPTIQAMDENVNVLVGANLSLNCDAIGFPIPTIRWEYQDTPLLENGTNIRFNEYGNMNVSNVTAVLEGRYSCVAENMVGVARKTFYVQIYEPPTIMPDNYTGSYIATDMDALLMISCKASGKPEPYVYWMKDDSYLDKDSRYDVDARGTLTIKKPSPELSGSYLCRAKNVNGETNKTVVVEIYPLPAKMQADESNTNIELLEGTNATVECPRTTGASDVVTWYKDAKMISGGHLQLLNVSRDNSSLYACVVTNAVGSAYAKVLVEVEWPPKFTREEMKEVEVVRGGDRWFDCEVDARPEAGIKWLFNSKVMLGEDKERLKLMNIQLHHTGVYKCILSNEHGTITRHFSLDVLVPPFISEFDLLDVQLKEGMNASLDCNARGSPTPEIDWTYNNTNWHLINSSLSATNVSTLSAGLYRCNARNKAGSAHIVYRVAIVAPPRVEEVILFEGELGVTVEGTAEIVLGSSTRVSCKASGQPIPTIQWIKNGQLLYENRKGISYADLTIDGVTVSHSGMYSCVSSNEGGMDERRIKVDVLEPPKIFQALFKNLNKTAKETKLEVMSGQTFYLHCHPYGNPMPEVYWFKDGLPLRFFDAKMVSTDFGEVVESPRARYDQSGNYTCVARNKIGNTSIVYLVDVLVPPPTPKEASHSVNTRVGRPLSLECPVEGIPPPDVMWIRHPYSDVTNTTRMTLSEDNVTLTIHKSEKTDSGLYSCVMSNKVGTTEVMFDVIIEKPPSIAGNVGANNTETRVVPLRRSVVLKCEVDGHPMPKISWLKDTQAVSSNTGNVQRVLGNSLLAIWRLGTRDAGQYICVADNGAGSQHRRYNVVAQVPGKWASWSQWSFCNVTCGLGYQARSRSCQYVDDYITIDEKSKSDKVVLDQSACRGPGSERRKCHMPPCEDEAAQWSGWSKWSVCSSSCGAGTQARTRRCRRGRCLGDNVQIRRCSDLPKCEWDSELSGNETRNRSSTEDEFDTENDPYTPEATFEFQPEVVNADEFSANTDPQLSVYDVKVSSNPGQGPCEPGYMHNDTTQECDDINECAIENNQCHSTQLCVNTAGGYRCGCAPGFYALGAGQRCLDINECAQGVDGCQYACVNVAGGHVCACPRHLRLHSDRRHCVPASSYLLPYQEPESEFISAMVEFPAKYKNTRN